MHIYHWCKGCRVELRTRRLGQAEGRRAKQEAAQARSAGQQDKRAWMSGRMAWPRGAFGFEGQAMEAPKEG
ncbi:MAG: hypothetical protein M1160_00135 [Candidatus Marsarchaeota archaeon]|nr:hypothetical protein [Candidatus Marsarchaeota archaeon]MCL5111279.1 hypothetical protein [Candidatus Marsarchaeota archaeon]